MESRNQRLALNWIGKGAHFDMEPRILVEDKSLSSPCAEGPEGIIIQSDNLLALKSLQQNFAEEVQCIFIDPPYNTGSAFEHYSDGVEHSIWLSLMYARLRELRGLLSKTGSIWISIDDNESHYLKVMCDEIFGRSNFIGNIVWQKKYTVANDARFFSANHDHILVYAKNIDLVRMNRLPRSDEMNARYANPDGHSKGPWKATPLHAKSGSASYTGFTFTFRNGRKWSPPPGTFPRFSEDTLKRLDDEDAIWFGKDGTAMPSRKTFLSELKSEGVPPTTVWLSDDVGHNHEAKNEAKTFNSVDVFDTPKPERLLQRILTIASAPGDLVLDSFAGSGTTGAVAHKMGRRWIMCELGSQAVTHILPRMRMVVRGTDTGGVSDAVGWAGGGGYKFFRLAPSLLSEDKYGNWVITKEYNPEMLAEALCKHMGYTYAPSQNADEYWNHGQATENAFIYVTTQQLTQDACRKIADDVGPERSLLICCKAYSANPDSFDNLTLVKIPTAILKKCEWGRDDYSLAIKDLPEAMDEPAQERPRTGGSRPSTTLSLFDDGDDTP